MIIFNFNFNSFLFRETDGLSVYEKIEEQLQWKHSSYYTTKGNRKMFCFIDDLNLAKV